jgi:CRISPR-associated protein Cas2
MMQESVYSKLVLNGSMREAVEHDIYQHRPRKGIVQMMAITEKQYSSIKVITGQIFTDTINDNKRVVIL